MTFLSWTKATAPASLTGEPPACFLSEDSEGKRNLATHLP